MKAASCCIHILALIAQVLGSLEVASMQNNKKLHTRNNYEGKGVILSHNNNSGDNTYPPPEGVCQTTKNGITGCTCPNETIVYCKTPSSWSDLPEACVCGQKCSKASDCPQQPSGSNAKPLCHKGVCLLGCLWFKKCPTDMHCIQDFLLVCQWRRR